MFNEKKYKGCIGHLISQKAVIVIIYLLIFAIIGFVAGYAITLSADGEITTALVGLAIGAVVGFFIGIFSTWKIEMKIQEAYWRIDMLNEFKMNNSLLTNQSQKISNLSVKEKPVSEVKPVIKPEPEKAVEPATTTTEETK